MRARTAVSPSMSSGTWLVHRIRIPGAASRRRTARSAAASMTCSQLSRMTNASVPLSRSNSGCFTAGDVHRGDHRVDDIVRRRRRLESWPTRHHPDAVDGARPSRSRAPSCRRRRVRRSRRAACVASRSDSAAAFCVATYEFGGHRRQVPGRRAAGRARIALGDRRKVTRRGRRICCSSRCSCGPGSRPSSSASRSRTRW